MAKTQTIKPEEMHARAYADRLILEQLVHMESAMKLGELADRLSGSGLGLAEVRALLASNPERFAFHERRWIPSSRVFAQGRPLAEGIRTMVDRFGGPMPMALLVQEVSRVLHRDAEIIEPMVRRIAESDLNLFITEDDRVALVAWVFNAHDETLDQAYALNGVTAAEVDVLDARLKINWRASDWPEAALKAAAPVSLKLLGAVAWKNLSSQDPRSILLYDKKEFNAKLLATPGFVYSADGTMHAEADSKKWISLAAKLADKLAPTVDVEDAAPIEVKPADVVKMVSKIKAAGVTITATKLLEEFYEITPSNRTFPDDMANIQAALAEQPEVWWVGGDRYTVPGVAPDYVESVPEPFEFIATDFLDEENELVDAELVDDGLNSSLRKLLLHPLAMDVLDEDIAPASKNIPETTRLVLKSIHRELGTFPMAQIPTGYLDPVPDIQELVFIDPSGRELQVWANHQARLLYNLIDWWYEQPVESGAVFSLTKTSKPNVFEFSWDDQTDPVVYISTQRMEELRNMQESMDQMSTLQVLIQVMSHWPKGADFLTLLAEVNVVRRVTRRMVASLLSSYQCFFQRSGSPVWHFDAKKVDLGFDKSKRKFVKK